MKRVLDASFRRYTLVAENMIAASTAEAQLLRGKSNCDCCVTTTTLHALMWGVLLFFLTHSVYHRASCLLVLRNKNYIGFR